MNSYSFDSKHPYCIIGGGASGLAAAALLARAGKPALVLERNARVGKKLAATGNGRCNLGHTPLELSRYHGDVELAKKVFANWQGAEAFFAELGMVCRADGDGRLYPHSNSANTVLDALRQACADATIACDTAVNSVEPVDGGFVINGQIFAHTVIWAGGGDFSLLRQLGHSVIEPFPSLCPVITDKALTRSLKGLRVRAMCRAVAAEGSVLKQELGEVQFNEGSLSGICIMNLSRLVRDYGDNMHISLDLAPDFTEQKLTQLLSTSPLGAAGLFHSRVAQTLNSHSRAFGVPLPRLIKDWRFPVTGVALLSQAQVTAGGVPARELNADLSSRIHPNLYIIGEAVNVDGDCGGYNLEWCWASAAIAGFRIQDSGFRIQGVGMPPIAIL